MSIPGNPSTNTTANEGTMTEADPQAPEASSTPKNRGRSEGETEISTNGHATARNDSQTQETSNEVMTRQPGTCRRSTTRRSSGTLTTSNEDKQRPTGTCYDALLDEMVPKFVKWYLATAHAQGTSRLQATLERHYYHPMLAKEVQNQVAKCPDCLKLKRVSRQYGQLAPRQAPTIPWLEIHTDCIGPWTFQMRRREISFCAPSIQ